MPADPPPIEPPTPGSAPSKSPAPALPGWNDDWAAAWRAATAAVEASPGVGLAPCRVVRIDKGGITVATGAGEERLVVAAKAVRRVVVGDFCGLDADAGRIELILPRSTVFERRAPGVSRDQLHLESRAVAANMDLVLVLQPLEPGLNTSRLARELVLAWESGALPIVVLTKADLVTESSVEDQVAAARGHAPGVGVHVVSMKSGRGLDVLAKELGAGHVVALLGASGAGKSSLVNSLAGRRVQLTAEVRDTDGRGRHTTTAGQMVELRDGALLIDTPGIRAVGLWAADDGLEAAFSDLVDYVQHCRFDDCTHDHEPGCGLLTAIADGRVEQERVDLWRELVEEIETVESGLEERGWAERREKNQRSRRRVRRRDQRLDDVSVLDED